MGRKGVGLERRGRASYPEAHTREGRANLSGGMGKGGSKDRVAEVGAAPGLGGPAAPVVGCAADVRLAVCHNRRMSKDYERRCATSEAFVYAAMVRLMVGRLARA